ncbi:MAG: MmgE/PrpD family protein, partial [Actinobacteria bacterium]|nr:MmgE/PrpD family protein [Actinomycetota bacterium]
MVSFSEIAEWASSLCAETLPEDVRRAAARERTSVRAAIETAWGTKAGRRWTRATPPGHERDAGLSALLNHDDYGFLGHPGHSAAVVAGGHEEAHVASAELALRLGAAGLLAPSHGQGWTFVHGPAAALAAGMRSGFDAKTLARAMGLAFLAPCSPTWGGLLATKAKPARVAEPVGSGLRAAALAAEGVVPPRRALADGLAAASFAPLTRLLDGFGERWFLPTLSFKPRPGSAYLQATLAALADLGPLERDDVAEVEVAAGATTLTMEALTR